MLVPCSEHSGPCWCREFVLEKLEIGKWVFLWVVLGQACSLGPAINVSQDNVDSSWPELVPYLYAILKDLTRWCSWSRQGGLTLQRQLKARSIQKTIQNPVMKVSFAVITADIPEDHMLEKGKEKTGKKEAQARKGRRGSADNYTISRQLWDPLLPFLACASFFPVFSFPFSSMWSRGGGRGKPKRKDWT